MSDPPPRWDPCDGCGNHTGMPDGFWGSSPGYEVGQYRASCWHPLQGLANLWGYRFADAGYHAGCSTCGATDLGIEMDFAPMETDYREVVPGSAEGDSRLKVPQVPTPAPAQPPGSAESRQAARGGMASPVARPAAYTQRLRR